MNSNKNNPEYSGFQNLILWVITPLFMLFITLFIPDKHRVIEVLVFLIGVPLMGVVVVATSTNLSFLYGFSAWKSIIRTVIVVLLVPAIMSVMYYAHYDSYLTSACPNLSPSPCRFIHS